MDIQPIIFLVILRAASMICISLEQINKQILDANRCHLSKDILQLNFISDTVKCFALCYNEPICKSYRVEKERCFLEQLPSKQGVMYDGKYYDACPRSKGYVKVSSPRICYKLSKDKLDWRGAEEQCEEEGGRLIVLSDRRVYNYLHSLLWDATSGARYWVGLKRYGKRKFGWTDGTTHVEKWQKDEPDYVSYQNCGAWYIHPRINDDGLSDTECADLVLYICEIVLPDDP